jgi:hypothetical protein
MKKLFISIALIMAGFSLLAQAGFEWAQSCGHPFYSETKSILEADADGNIFMAGNFIETAEFGTDYITSAGGTDIFIAKYNKFGEVLWLLGDGGEDYDYLHGIASDEAGFYTGGSFYGTTSIGGQSFTSAGSQDLFIARYNQIGEIQWVQQFSSPKTDYLNAIDSDPFGNLFITGHYYDSIAIGGTTIYSVGGSDIFIAKFDITGKLIWVQQASGSSSDQSYSLSCDADGNLAFSGSFFEDITLGDVTLTTEDPTGVFMAKYNNDGELIFAQQVDGNGLIAKSFVSFDSEGDIYFAGNFTNEVHFGPYTFIAGEFNIDVFITRYTADGTLLWADHGHGLGSDALIAIAPGPLNDLYISGHYLDTIHFSDLTLEYTLCCGSAEIFLVRYTEDGIPSWGDQVSGERAMAESMCKNSDDELFVSGLFLGELTLGEMIIESGTEYSNYLSGIATGTMTSTDEQTDNISFNLFPVPADNELNIQFEKNISSYTYEIFDLTGRKMLQGSIAGEHGIDISGIPSGQYLIRLYNAETGLNEGMVFLKR